MLEQPKKSYDNYSYSSSSNSSSSSNNNNNNNNNNKRARLLHPGQNWGQYALDIWFSNIGLE